MLPSSGTPQEAIARKQKLDDDFIEAEHKVMRMLSLGAAITRNLVLDQSVFMDETLALRTSNEVARQLTEYYELIEGVRSLLRRLEPRLTNLEFRRSIVPAILKEQFEQGINDCQQQIDDLFRCLKVELRGYPSFVASDTMSTDKGLTSGTAVSGAQTAATNAGSGSS